MSVIEIIATLLGVANILLLVRRSIWNYPFAIAMVSLYAWIFFGERLYSDTLLQIFFLILNIYGWLNWRRAQDDAGLPVRWLGGRGFALCAGAALVATGAWGWAMHRYTNAAYPFWDAAVAMFSVLAQWLLARRYIDNWIWWIIVDCLAMPLYWVKNLHLTAALYMLFLLLSMAGLVEWVRARKAAA